MMHYCYIVMLLIKIESLSEHCRMHHKWLCEKRNIPYSIFSLRIILWLFLLLFLIHCQKKTNWRIKKERNSSIQIIQFSVRIVFDFFLEKKLIWTFFALFPCLYIFDGERDPGLQAQNAKETSHLIFRNYLRATNALLERE